MRHRSTQALYRYWDGLRGERPAPARTEINPRGIAAILGDVFLLGGSPGDFRFRLAGSRIVEALGTALTGVPFDEIWREAARQPAEHALAAGLFEADPVLIGIRVRAPGDAATPASIGNPRRPDWPNFRDSDGVARPERRETFPGAGEMLLLPLRHEGRTGSRILGSLAVFDPPLIPPAQMLLLDMTSARILGRAARPVAGTGLLSAALAERIVMRRGHLGVIEGRPTEELPVPPVPSGI